MREYQLPQILADRVVELLRELGFSPEQPAALANAITRLSQFYIENPEHGSPLHEKWAQAAYLAYFFPLNYARACAAAKEAVRRGFLDGIESYIDFGSGLGSAAFAFEEVLPFKSRLCIDRSDEALDLQRKLREVTAVKPRQIEWLDQLPETLPERSSRAAILSYTLTELSQLPRELEASEALILLEPSTRSDGRRLQNLRQDLIERGFYAWAPCTHQGACPLLAESDRDWCHDRIHWRGPSWWAEIEKLLPMKNLTITFSYLLMRRTPPPESPMSARLVGDLRVEKGKTRIMLCRGPEREFLSWFPQRIAKEPDLMRGQRIKFNQVPVKKSNEVRLQSCSDITIEAPAKNP